MSKKKEALRLALEALEGFKNPDLSPQDSFEQCELAITAIREALAEQPARQESEAVRAAWMAGYTEGEREAIEKEQQPAQQHIEHCLWARNGNQPCPHVQPAQPSKPWVGLTEQERDFIWDTVGNSDAHGDVDGWSGREVMKAIEAKLKEKNNG